MICRLFGAPITDAFEDASLGFLDDDWLTLKLFFVTESQQNTSKGERPVEVNILTGKAVSKVPDTGNLVDRSGSQMSMTHCCRKETTLASIKEQACVSVCNGMNTFACPLDPERRSKGICCGVGLVMW